MTEHPFNDAQRIVLRGTAWDECRHLVLSFPKGSYPLSFLKALMKAPLWPTRAGTAECNVQVSLGFSRRGLERSHVPNPLLALFALKAPAFMAGAAARAASQLGATGSDAPASWDKAFKFATLDAVLSVHVKQKGQANAAVDLVNLVNFVEQAAKQHGVQICKLATCSSLPMPIGPTVAKPTAPSSPKATLRFTHFGYRDGLARVGIKGWHEQKKLSEYKPDSIHPAGEFLLGYPQHGGANPWIAGPGAKVWPKEIRAFFANGSFGVLQQIEQHVKKFEAFVESKAQALGMTSYVLKAKLCGRYTDGLPLVAKVRAKPEDDFDYTEDPQGYACPFGSHIRRMNPRGDSLAHSGRLRPLLRRGMTYGPDWYGEQNDADARGLLGHFFCASIEDQFEHLIGQWADRVPLGSQDTGGARDPLIGAHECNDGAFVIDRPSPSAPRRLFGLQPFTRTRGTAYLFYPSLQTLARIADSSFWGLLKEGDD